MIKIQKYDTFPLSGYAYGGRAGSKLGIIIDDEPWFIKYPKATKSLKNVNISYTTSPLSEYLGSDIYESLGIEVQKTKLGIANNKVIVVCKDFLNTNEILYDYQEIRNSYNQIIEEKKEELSSTSSDDICNLEELELIMKENYYFKNIPF